jgi:hypothetical protein
MLQYIVEMYVESTHVKMDRIDGLSALGRGILITIGLTPQCWAFKFESIHLYNRIW